MPGIYDKYLERGGTAVFTPESLDKYQEAWSAIFNHANSNDYIRDMRINENLSVLLTLIMEYSWHKQSTRQHRKFDINAVKLYLDENYANKITLDELSERYYINKYSLSRAFSESFDTTIIGYVNNLRITYAKQLLRFSSKTIENIATECGFESLYYFSRVFKQVEGISPSQYRMKW